MDKQNDAPAWAVLAVQELPAVGADHPNTFVEVNARALAASPLGDVMAIVVERFIDNRPDQQDFNNLRAAVSRAEGETK